MIEPLVTGIVLGLIPVTLIGLYVAAYLQYIRGNELSKIIKEEENKLNLNIQTTRPVIAKR